MEISSEFDDYCDDYRTGKCSYQGLNSSLLTQLDYIPLVSTITGVARIAFGSIQAIVGIFLIPIEVVLELSSEETHQLVIINGLANVFRGVVAFPPILGNATLYLYDRSRLFN